MRTHLKLIVLGLSGALILSSCKKVEGTGGTSSITGTLSGITLSGSNPKPAEQEITTVICTHADGIGGSILDNSDYFLLNTPNNGTYYYVWFENTNWPGQDPSLSGRTGIKVTYSNNESNVTIANNTYTAIIAAASADFSVTVFNDVLTITNNLAGPVPDADDVNTPFSVDVAQQGKNATTGSSGSVAGPIVDERVYIIYGEEDFYSESVRTDASGNFQFKGLQKGNYRVFAFSLDTMNLSLFQEEVNVEITKKKEVVIAPDLQIVK